MEGGKIVGGCQKGEMVGECRDREMVTEWREGEIVVRCGIVEGVYDRQVVKC